MNPRKDLGPEIAELWERLEKGQGVRYWRSLDEVANTKAFQSLMEREFPEQALEWDDLPSRRRFLTLMSASLALAGLAGCSVRPAPSSVLVPYVQAPEEMVPGKPLFYATAMTLGGIGVGLLVESHAGRPTKIEGNPQHPGSLGATNPFHQAAVLTLYDPDRSQTVTKLGQPATWDDALTALKAALDKLRPAQGAGFRLLTETVVSPTLVSQIDELLKVYPQARWHHYEPLVRDSALQGARLAFGPDQPVHTYYDFEKADVVLALDADFLGCDASSIANSAQFMARRRVRTSLTAAKHARMNRLYVAEVALTRTGAKADHRLALPGKAIEGLARSIAAHLGVAGEDKKNSEEDHAKWIAAVANDLDSHRGRSLVIAGDRQPAVVHLIAHALNDLLNNVGKTVFHTAPVEAFPDEQMQSLNALAEDMDQGRVDLLVILGGNPVFAAPANFRFAQRMQKVPLRFHLSLYQDETSLQCQWHLPEAHFLESWSDTRAYDGTASIIQPLIEPLYQGRSAHELLSTIIGPQSTPAYDLVRSYWRRNWNSRKISSDFEDFWQKSVHDGVVAGTKSPTRHISLANGWEKLLIAEIEKAGHPADQYELAFDQDPTIFDGRFANNAWLQELPKPITRLTWDNAALISPATAKELGIGLGSYAHGGEHGGYHQPMIELQVADRKLQMPVWIMPGHADRSVTVYLGYGRESAGKVGGNRETKVGFNAYQMRTSDHPWFVPGLTIHKTKDTYLLAGTQQHHLMEQRDIVRAATLKEYQQNPAFAQKAKPAGNDNPSAARTPLTLYAPHEYTGRKWGMAIDLSTCTGCNACVVACQAENNIPVVGKDQVAAGREMHWLRVDHYSGGSATEPKEFYFQPVPCMHCENAPCEYVCPVEATVHSADGLNDMIYQRCVGTRFCSNNCPYKVRRFNFFSYADYATQSLRLQYNPDVTVRSRGVMEKCTYCVQRIRKGEIEAEVERRPIADGEVLTACQAACPADAIVFGDINDEGSLVKKWKESPLNYALLSELNTEPRTTYLAALRNPNPQLEV